MIFRIHVDFAGCIPLISWCFAGSFHVATQAFLQVDLFEELGGADVHTSKSGVADHFAENEPEVCPVSMGSLRPSKNSWTVKPLNRHGF